MPHIQKLHEEIPSVAIFGISDEDSGTLAQFCREHGLTYRILLDEGGKTFSAYKGKYIPYAVVINKKGIVTNIFVGNYPDDLRQAVRNQLSVKAVAAANTPESPEACEELNLGAPPVKIGGRIWVPVRGILEWTGASVGWDSRMQTITARAGSWCLALAAGTNASAPKGCRMVDVPVRMIGGRAYVSLRDVQKSLGLKLTYAVQSKGIYLKLPSRCGFLPFR